MDYLKRLIAHLVWADHQAGDALRRAHQPPAATLALFAHVLGAEHVWLARLSGKPSEVAVWPDLGLEACASLGWANAGALQALVDSLDQESVRRPVTYTNSAGQSFSNRVEDILLHLCLHGAYHRGQVARDLRQSGSQPEPTDYIAFIRGAPAARR